MSFGWSDYEDAERFWKNIKTLRDDVSIKKDELPERLKDAAAENPQYFVKLVDDMIKMYENEKSTKGTIRSRDRRIRNEMQFETDSTSRCRSVISVDHSEGPIEVFVENEEDSNFGSVYPPEIDMSDDASGCRSVVTFDPGMDAFSFRRTSEIVPRDDVSIAKSVIAFDPNIDAVEVCHREIECDDDASQVSALSYASQVADTLRNLRYRISARNSELAAELAKDFEDISSLQQATKTTDKKSIHKQKETCGNRGRDISRLQERTKEESRCRVQADEIPPRSTDHRDDVSLLTADQGDVLQANQGGEATSQKTRKGRLRRLLGSKKFNLLRGRRARVQSTIPRDSDRSQIMPEKADDPEKEVSKNRDDEIEEDAVSSEPISIQIAPYCYSRTPTPDQDDCSPDPNSRDTVAAKCVVDNVDENDHQKIGEFEDDACDAEKEWPEDHKDTGDTEIHQDECSIKKADLSIKIDNEEPDMVDDSSERPMEEGPKPELENNEKIVGDMPMEEKSQELYNRHTKIIEKTGLSRSPRDRRRPPCRSPRRSGRLDSSADKSHSRPRLSPQARSAKANFESSSIASRSTTKSHIRPRLSPRATSPKKSLDNSSLASRSTTKSHSRPRLSPQAKSPKDSFSPRQIKGSGSNANGSRGAQVRSPEKRRAARQMMESYSSNKGSRESHSLSPRQRKSRRNSRNSMIDEECTISEDQDDYLFTVLDSYDDDGTISEGDNYFSNLFGLSQQSMTTASQSQVTGPLLDTFDGEQSLDPFDGLSDRDTSIDPFHGISERETEEPPMTPVNPAKTPRWFTKEFMEQHPTRGTDLLSIERSYSDAPSDEGSIVHSGSESSYSYDSFEEGPAEKFINAVSSMLTFRRED